MGYFFYGYIGPWYLNYSQPGMFPNAPATTATTTTPTTIVTPTSADQPLVPIGYPWFPGRYKPYAHGMPRYFYHGQPGMFPNTPATTATTTTTTTPTTTPATVVAPTSAERPFCYPWLPGPCKSFGYDVPWCFNQGWPGTLKCSHNYSNHNKNTNH